MTITPAMQQYYDMKSHYSDAILFFRMGDFYEMFEDDAQIAHKILGIALTSRNKNAENPVLLAGIPFHAKEKYLPLLVQAGYKVAIAEQTSSAQAKGIVERQVVRVVTPATIGLE
jgi:DNA mismatch repair protein MutS